MQYLSRPLFVSALGVMLAFGFPALGHAQSADKAPAILKSLYGCKSIDDPDARLKCYDEGVGRVEAATEAGEIVVIDKDTAEEIKRESFGFNLPSLPKIALPSLKNDTPAIDEVVLTITSARKKGYNDAVFYTDNGQVWEASAVRVKIPKGDGHTLHIRSAALGSFLAQIDGKGAAFRVKRRE